MLIEFNFPSTHCFVQLIRKHTPSSLEEAKYIDLSGKDIGRRQISSVVILHHLKSKHRVQLDYCVFLPVAIERLGVCRRLQTLVLCGNSIDALRNLDCCRQLWKIDLSGNRVSSALTRTLQPPCTICSCKQHAAPHAILEQDALGCMATSTDQ